MKTNVFKEVDIIWKALTQNAGDKESNFSLEVHKKFLNFFQVGDFYYYIFNVKQSMFELMSKEVTDVLGYNPDEIDVPFFVSKIHPEDQQWFINFESKVAEFFNTLTEEQIPNYKVRYDYRIKKKNGDYIRILQQVVTIQFDDKAILRTFGVHTNITHIKNEGLPILSFIGMNGEPSYIGVDVKKVFSQAISVLTPRELEVLSLLVEGKSSEEIGKMLFISKLTVNTHRKNLLEKTNCKNTAALISLAIKKGWI